MKWLFAIALVLFSAGGLFVMVASIRPQTHIEELPAIPRIVYGEDGPEITYETRYSFRSYRTQLPEPYLTGAYVFIAGIGLMLLGLAIRFIIISVKYKTIPSGDQKLYTAVIAFMSGVVTTFISTNPIEPVVVPVEVESARPTVAPSSDESRDYNFGSEGFSPPRTERF